MHTVRKSIALVLSASFALTASSCTPFNKIKFLEAASHLAHAAVARDYESIEKCADEGDRKLKNILELYTDTEDQDNEARELIASSLTYDVVEDSFRSDLSGSHGSVDVCFSYTDYTSAVESRDVFWDVDDFSDALDLCANKVVTTITFYFSKEEGELLCTNISDIEALFPYSDLDLEFAGDLADYVGEMSFTGDSQRNGGYGLCDISMINCSLEISGYGQNLPWQYYCIVKNGSSTVFTSNVIDVDCPGSLDMSYTDIDPDTGIMEDGTYTFSFYTADDELIAESSVSVTHTILNNDAVPVPVASSPGNQYLCPDDGMLVFPGCDLVFDLPDGMHFCEPDSPQVQTAIESDVGDAVISIVVGDEGGPYQNDQLTVIDSGMNINCSSSSNIAYVDAFMDGFVADYEEMGYTCTEESFYYPVGDQEYYVRRFIAETDDICMCITYALLGDEDTTFIASWLTSDFEESDIFLDSLSWAS